MKETRERIIETAMDMIRTGGYHSFSFRQIADRLGIKSASIHYHFPSKEMLGVAVAEEYTRLFLQGLGDPADQKNPIRFYVDVFEGALATNEAACLCGILAAESGGLPEAVTSALAEFTHQNIAWLRAAVKRQRPDWSRKRIEDTASLIFSALEGAIVFASMTNSPGHLKRVGNSLGDVVAA